MGGSNNVMKKTRVNEDNQPIKEKEKTESPFAESLLTCECNRRERESKSCARLDRKTKRTVGRKKWWREGGRQKSQGAKRKGPHAYVRVASPRLGSSLEALSSPAFLSVDYTLAYTHATTTKKKHRASQRTERERKKMREEREQR